MSPTAEPPMATITAGITHAASLVPSVCRIQPNSEMIEPRMTITLFGFPFAALLDTGAAISLIGDAAYELCKNQKITFRSADTRLQLASNLTISAGGAVRLKISFNENTQR